MNKQCDFTQCIYFKTKCIAPPEVFNNCNYLKQYKKGFSEGVHKLAGQLRIAYRALPMDYYYIEKTILNLETKMTAEGDELNEACS